MLIVYTIVRALLLIQSEQVVIALALGNRESKCPEHARGAHPAAPRLAIPGGKGIVSFSVIIKE